MLITLNGESSATQKDGSYDFTNSIRSGITLKPDTKVALVSAAIERVIDIVIVQSTNGNIKVEINHTAAAGYNYTNVSIPSGTYTYESLLTELETRLDAEFGSQGYLFALDKVKDAAGDDVIEIKWNVADISGVAGLPTLPTTLMTDSSITTATPDAVNQVNNLSMLGSTQNVWYMAACPNTMPNNGLFPVPTEDNPKVGNFVEIGQSSLAAATDEAILGVYDPTADLPSGDNNDVGAFGFAIEPNGSLRIYETKYAELNIDYISGGQLWGSATYPTNNFKFIEYVGANGYDYILDEQGGAQNYYVKRVPGQSGEQAYFNTSDKSDVANYDNLGTLNAGKTIFSLVDQSGGSTDTITMTASQIPPKLNTNHGLAKGVHTLAAGSFDKDKGSLLAGWGKEGFVKYFYKQDTANPNYTEIVFSDPNRASVDEMFGPVGSGHGFDSYYGLKMTAGSISAPLNAIDKLSHTASTNNTATGVNASFINDNITNYDCTITAEVLPATASVITNTAVGGGLSSSNASFTRQPFRNTNWTMIVNNSAGNPSGQFGLLDTTQFNNFTSQGATSGGIWNSNGNHLVRVLWSASGFRIYNAGSFANGSGSPIAWATTGNNPKIEVEIDGSGHANFYYYKESDSYTQRYSLLSAGSGTNLIASGDGILMKPYFVFTDTNTINTFTCNQENTSVNTGVVAFNPDTMNNILGFNAGDYLQGNGATGFTSNRSLGFAESFTCASPLIHINLKNLPLQSLNGKTNRQEHAIAVIPRYNLDNAEGGDSNVIEGTKTIFYYEPYNMIYQPLNNDMPITMNELSVSMLNSDGTFATDLECSNIVLDIQPNPVALLRR